MIIQCEQCNVKYRLDESRIPGERAKVKCSRCNHIFLVSNESPSPSEPLQLPIEEETKESGQAPFQCPQCGFQQPHSEECIKCGIIFSKYKPRSEMPPPPYHRDAGEFGLDQNLIYEQAEPGPMTYAGFWRRFGACFIDGIVVWIIAFIILMVTVGPTWLVMLPYLSQIHMTGNPPSEAMLSASASFAFLSGISLSVLLPVLYFIIMWGRKGATLGKMAMGIRIVRTDGSDISYGTAFLRYIGYQLVSPALFCLGFLWMLWDKRGQTWHDKIASTCVVRTQ